MHFMWKIIVFLPTVLQTIIAGTPCPPYETIKPCFCTGSAEGQTIIICAGLRNSSQLQVATNAMKSMIIDKFILLLSFSKTPELFDIEDDDDDESSNSTNPARLPKNWLASVKVKGIEIQDSYLPNSFMRDSPLTGQSDYLTDVIVKYSSLQGHLCSVCNTKLRHISTREFIKTPNLSSVDFSHNHIEVISGLAFPEAASKLSKISLSNNAITTIHDKAFENLASLAELDLSHNQLTKFSRKMFKLGTSRNPVNPVLQSLDLSWNSIQYLPNISFQDLTNLKELKLAHNLLETLPSDTFSKLPTLIERIEVHGNFLVCNCSLAWISKDLQKSTKVIGRCVSPKPVEFQDLKSALTSARRC